MDGGLFWLFLSENTERMGKERTKRQSILANPVALVVWFNNTQKTKLISQNGMRNHRMGSGASVGMKQPMEWANSIVQVSYSELGHEPEKECVFEFDCV